LSRFEGRFQADGQVGDPEVATLLGRLHEVSQAASAAERQEAIVCLLSASDGWRRASKRLRGTFARPITGDPLKTPKGGKE
jgi:hypothetical protein